MAAGQQAAAQAKQQQKQLQAELAANAKKGEAFIKRSVVPGKEPGACAQEGFGRTPECEGKAGDLNLKPGEYEITVEKGSRIGTTYTPVEVERKTVCMTEEGPVPGALGAGRPTRVKRGKEKITWTDAAGGRELRRGPRLFGEEKKGGLRHRREQDIEGPGQGNPESLRLLTTAWRTRSGRHCFWPSSSGSLPRRRTL
ncbi:MAG TPA: hypothetical protein VIJ89_07055 [Deferrimonas sp.]